MGAHPRTRGALASAAAGRARRVARPAAARQGRAVFSPRTRPSRRVLCSEQRTITDLDLALRGAQNRWVRVRACAQHVPANTGEFAARIAALRRASRPCSSVWRQRSEAERVSRRASPIAELAAQKDAARDLRGAGAFRACRHVRSRGERDTRARGPQSPRGAGMQPAAPSDAPAEQRATAAPERSRSPSREPRCVPVRSHHARGAGAGRDGAAAIRSASRRSADLNGPVRRRSHRCLPARRLRRRRWRTTGAFSSCRRPIRSCAPRRMRRLGDLNLESGELERMEKEVGADRSQGAEAIGSIPRC